MTTFASVFTGFDGVGVGARDAGLELAWGIELEPAIAEVANANLGSHVRVMNILDADPHDFERVDVLHASPPCPNFSVAKSGRGETKLDLALAGAVAFFVRKHKPRIFTLENVWAYRASKSWQVIEDSLNRMGYWTNVTHVNFADFGVPQTRKRMIVRAVLGGWVPYLPAPEPWVGWYAAIEDLIPTLPESRFADWQVSRLPEHITQFLATVQGAESDYLEDNQPAPTITSAHGAAKYRAFIVGQNYGSPNTSEERKLNIRQADEPVFVVETNVNRLSTRAWLSTGHVIAMTPRALARFQSFPDWYELPAKASLACKGIGNAVPPLAYQKIISQLVNGA